MTFLTDIAAKCGGQWSVKDVLCTDHCLLPVLATDRCYSSSQGDTEQATDAVGHPCCYQPDEELS
jgi:hypothetical protein